MPGEDQEYKYQLFISYTEADRKWAEQLYRRLADIPVRVFFAHESIQAGEHITLKVSDALDESYKVAIVMSQDYFDRSWPRAEFASMLDEDPENRDRRLIPLKRRECKTPRLLSGLKAIDFTNDDDFELSYRQLLEALDLPKHEFDDEVFHSNLPGFDPDRAERGRRGHSRGKRFEDEIAMLYRLLGFDVKQDVKINGVQFDLQVEKRDGGWINQAVVECKNKQVTSGERDQILAQQNVIQRSNPRLRWVTVSSQGFAADTRSALESAGVDCITYSELMRELVPLQEYAAGLIADYDHYRAERWEGNDWFIRPEVTKDISYDKLAALEFLGGWLGDTRSNELVILGDLGTGKSTLMNFLAYQLAQSFLSDPLRHPAPVLVPLGEVRKKLDFDSIITHHLSSRGLRDVRVSAFEHLVRGGKIILLFDGFDEMADRVQWSVTEDNFNALLKPAGDRAKIIVTCRTHYFKNRREQIKLTGDAPRLSESETALYGMLRQRSGAQVVYLEEFDDDRIKTYLEKVRGQANVAADWEKIQRIHNLKDLATRPLLLDMIVKSLPQLDAGQQINAANLYTVYTNLWVARERDKRREILDPRERLELMKELAWRMWRDEKEKEGVDYRQLEDFITELMRGKVLEIQDAEPETVVREMQSATFINRGKDSAHFKFMHRSFMEFFLARKLYEAITGVSSPTVKEGDAAQRRALTDGRATDTVSDPLSWLDTRRFDQKVVYFLTLLDEQDQLVEPMRQILAGPYQRNVSENALQILYWGGRVRADMEAEVSTKNQELRKLWAEFAKRFPPKVQLTGARLQEIELIHARLDGADFTGAELAKAKLDYAQLNDARFRGADLTEASLNFVTAARADFSKTMALASFAAADLTDADFSEATYTDDSFADAELAGVRGLTGVSGKINLKPLLPVAQNLAIDSGYLALPVCFSPNGELLAIGTTHGTILIVRASDSALLRTLSGHTQRVLSVAFSLDGKTLASGSDDKSVRLWSAEDGRSLRTLSSHSSSVWSVAFSPDGKTLASGSDDKSVRLWSAEDGRSLRTLSGHTSHVWSVAFSPDGRTLASGSDDKSVRLWSLEDGRSLRTLSGHTDSVLSVAFSPDGKTLASGSDDNSVRLWSAEDGRSLRTLSSHSNSVWSVAFSPDGKTLASGSYDKSVRLWSPEDGRSLRTLSGHTARVLSVAFSPDGETLASGSSDNSVRLWSPEDGRSLRTLSGHSNSVLSVAFSPDGKTLASGSDDNSVSLWSPEDGRSLRTLSGHNSRVWSVAFSPDGKTLASGSDDKLVRLWSAEDGRSLRILSGHTLGVLSVAFSPDGKMLAGGSDDRSVRLWLPEDRYSLRTLSGHTESVLSVAFSPDGKTLASGSSDNSVRLWSPEDGRSLPTLSGHTSRVWSVAFSPDGKTLASGSDDNSVRLWSPEDGRSLRTLSGHTSSVLSVAFSPDGKTLASGSDDNSVRLWSPEDGECLAVLGSTEGSIQSVAFAPSGRFVCGGGAAGRLQVWDVQSGETVLWLYNFGEEWLMLLPDGRFDVSLEALRYLRYTEIGTFNSYRAEDLVKEFHSPEAVKSILAKMQK